MLDASRLWDDAWIGFATEVAVKATIVLVAAAAVTSALRSASAAWRHRVWSVAFAGVLLLPAFQLVLPGWRWQVLPQRPNQVLSPSVDAIVAENVDSSPPGSAETHRAISAPDSGNRPPTRNDGRIAAEGEQPAPIVAKPSAAVDVAAPTAMRRAHSSGHWPVGIWGAGLAASLAPLVAGVIGNARLKRRARPLSDAATERRVGALCRRLGLRQRPALLLGDHRQMPMTFGLYRPVVVMPAGATQWSEERFSSVLLHEFAHIKRGDVPWQLAARIACGIHWFNPLAWWALGRMRRDRELSCDDCVLSAGQNSANYASELLNIAREHATRFPSMCAALTMARRSQLEGRILAVLDGDRRRAPAGVVRTAVLALAACGLVAGLSGVHLATRASAADEGAVLAAGSTPDDASRCIVTGVVLSPDGEPVAGTQVEFIIHGHKGGWSRPLPDEKIIDRAETHTDERGSFRFDVPRSVSQQRSASVVASAAGVFPAIGDIDTRLPHTEAELQLLKTKKVRLQLVDPVGMPIPEVVAQIRFISMDGDKYIGTPHPAGHEAVEAWPTFSRSDDQGYAEAELPITTKRLTLFVDDPQKGAHRFDVEVSDKPVSAVLDTASFLRGKVTDADGTPIVGAEVFLMEEPYRRVTTDAAGEFRAARGSTVSTMFPNGESIIHVYPPADSEFLFKAQEWKWPNDGIGDAELTITLDRGVMVEGRVVESGSGAPVAGARLVFEPQVENNPNFNESLRSRFAGADMRYITDAAGRFRMPVCLGPGRLLVSGPTLDFVPVEISMGDLWYGKPGLQREYYHGVARLDLKEGAKPEPVAIELTRGATLRRRVTRPDGAPAKGVAFAASYLQDKESINSWLPSVPVTDGQIELPGFDPVRSTPLFILDVDGQCGCVVSPDAGHISPDEMTFKLKPCGSAKFRFVNDKGEPLADFQPPIHLVFKPGAPATHHIEPDQPLWSDTIIWDNVVRPKKLPKTDPDGRVVVDGLIPDASYHLYYVGRAANWDEGYPFAVKSGETTDVGEVVIPQQD